VQIEKSFSKLLSEQDEVYYAYLFLLRFVNILIRLGFICATFCYQLL